MKKRLAGVIVLLLMGYSLPGWAACGLPAASASFGTTSSFTLNTTVNTTTANILVNCGAGSAVSLLPTDYVSLQLASVSFSSGTRGALKVTASGSDAIPVRVCTDPACNNEMQTGGASTTYSRAQLLNLVGTGGGQNFSIPLYLSTVAGQSVAAGSYTLTLNFLVSYSICTGVGAAGLCLLGSQQTGSGTVPVTTTLVVTNDCTTITAANISFGSAPLASSFNKVSQTINVICTKGSTYSVGISNGSHAVGSQRNMINGNTLLAYEIYKSASTARWGPTGTDRVSSTAANGVSPDGLTRTFNYTAQVLPGQITPAAGSYSDSVVVDLSF